ncbi:MAG: peptidase S8, partial [Candidatus Eremiobacteraeota bacterium]|nr:peptidase S8 [Candidatus Eremiobacteraeota bacterium]
SSSLLPSAIPGLHPSDLQSAYALPSASRGTGERIAIVVPFNGPAAENDLAVYRNKFGLGSCSSASGCLQFVGHDGSKGKKEQNNSPWSAELSIDLQMVSASCPHCGITVVEAQSDGFNDMIVAELTAVSIHPNVVSNSWSIPESSEMSQMGTGAFVHPGTAVVAGSGDSGAGVSWPAAEPSVIAVGGTFLQRDAYNARGWDEAGWANAGFGCSAYVARPAWQLLSFCGANRSIADVAAVADPRSGVAIYNSTAGGWVVYGGTSVAAPIVAGVIALAGNSSSLVTAQYVYQHGSALNPVQTGVSVLQGGLGSPNGIAAF